MTTAADEKGDTQPGSVDSLPPQDTLGDDSGCNCNRPPDHGSRKVKVAVCVVVALAVGAILYLKTTGNQQNGPDRGGDCGSGCGPKGCPTSATPSTNPQK